MGDNLPNSLLTKAASKVPWFRSNKPFHLIDYERRGQQDCPDAGLMEDEPPRVEAISAKGMSRLGPLACFSRGQQPFFDLCENVSISGVQSYKDESGKIARKENG